MNIDLSLLLAPIDAEQPGGLDARESEHYEAITAEIEKMTSLSGTSPVDWPNVALLGQQILATQSKDFMIAAWLSAAWTQQYGIDGVAAGLQLHLGMVKQYWDNGFPGLKRLRGRRNALSWWLDRTSDWLAATTPPPLPSALHTDMVDALAALDAELAERDPDGPALGSFLRQIKALDILPEPANDSATQPASADETASHQPPAEAAAQHAPASPNAAATPRSTSPSAPPAAPAAGSLPEVGELSTLDDVVRSLAPATGYLAHVAAALMAIDRCHPLVIETSRYAARAPLLAPPPAQQGMTALPAPPSAILDAFASICQAGNADGMIAFCESRLVTFPYWLDLDCQAARGFGLLGEAGAPARRAIVQHALSFIERLPGIETLCFSDGTPFASESTRHWLEQCRAEQRGGAPTDPVAQAQQQARAAVDAGRHDDAFTIYQCLVSGTWNGRDRFRARLALAQWLAESRSGADLDPFIDPLIDECQARDMACWEPELAAQAWQLKARAARQALDSAQTVSDPVLLRERRLVLDRALGQLAALDFAQAARLTP